MLDQYQGTLHCVVNYNDGLFAECDIVDAVSINPETSIHDEFWLGLSRAQVHADPLGLDEELVENRGHADYTIDATWLPGREGAPSRLRFRAITANV